MKIKIERPHPDYPLVEIIIDVTTSLDDETLSDILASHRISLLGRWKPYTIVTGQTFLKAPGLLEDEHVKPKGRRRKNRG